MRWLSSDEQRACRPPRDQVRALQLTRNKAPEHWSPHDSVMAYWRPPRRSWGAPVHPVSGAGAPAVAQSHESAVPLAPEEEPPDPPAPEDGTVRRTSRRPRSGVANERGGNSRAAPCESSSVARGPPFPVHAARAVPSGGLFCRGPVNCSIVRRWENKAEGVNPRPIAPANKADSLALPGQCSGGAWAAAPTGCAHAQCAKEMRGAAYRRARRGRAGVRGRR